MNCHSSSFGHHLLFCLFYVRSNPGLGLMVGVGVSGFRPPKLLPLKSPRARHAPEDRLGKVLLGRIWGSCGVAQSAGW